MINWLSFEASGDSFSSLLSFCRCRGVFLFSFLDDEKQFKFDFEKGRRIEWLHSFSLRSFERQTLCFSPLNYSTNKRSIFQYIFSQREIFLNFHRWTIEWWHRRPIRRTWKFVLRERKMKLVMNLHQFLSDKRISALQQRSRIYFFKNLFYLFDDFFEIV